MQTQLHGHHCLCYTTSLGVSTIWNYIRTYLPSNRCFKKSKSAFCIISVTWKKKQQNMDGNENNLYAFVVTIGATRTVTV